MVSSPEEEEEENNNSHCTSSMSEYDVPARVCEDFRKKKKVMDQEKRLVFVFVHK